MAGKPAISKSHRSRHYMVMVATAIWLFAAFPFVEIASTRSAPFFLIFVFVVVLVRLATGNIHSPDGKIIGWQVLFAAEPPARRMLLFSIAALLAWGLLSLFWTPLPLKGTKDIVAFALAGMSFLLLAHQFHLAKGRYFRQTLFVGLISASLVLVLDLNYLKSLYRLFADNVIIDDLNRNAATLALLIWPALAFLGFRTMPRKAAFLALLSLCFVVVFSSDGQSAQLGILAGLVAGISSWVSRYLFRALIGFLALTILVFPLLVPMLNSSVDLLPERLVESAHVTHRLQIWRGYAELIGEHPYRGLGMHAHEKRGNDGSIGQYAKRIGLPALANHPHNFILEIWVDLGAIGAILLSGLLLAAGMLADGLKRPDRVLFAQVLMSGFVISALGHGFTQSWWIATITIACIAVSQVMHDPPSKQAT